MSGAPESSSWSLPERGLELCVLDYGGSGPLALLGHANGFCAGMWGLAAPKLATRFRVLAFDMRGHGDSGKPDRPEAYAWDEFARDWIALAERLCAHHGESRVALGAGVSFGGTTLLAAAADRPDLFGHLALLDPVVPMPPESFQAPHLERRNTMVEVARRRRRVFASRAEARANWAGRDVFAEWDPRALDLYVQYGLGDRPDGQVELKCGEAEAWVFEGSQHFDVLAHARRNTVPGLVLHAAQGHFPPALHQALADASPALAFEPMAGGHLLPWIIPDTVAERLLAFAAP